MVSSTVSATELYLHFSVQFHLIPASRLNTFVHSRIALRQDGVFPHTSRLALGNLWKTLDVRVSGFAFVNKEWGTSELRSANYEASGQKTFISIA
ncbi:hypothetical protein FLM05_06095 [Vibrio cholerae]|nr:hypothetical protein EC575_19125 [Vibrio cholerae]TQO89439.1 hypothetical protein FLM05_06095 [Vibrio cholerae]TQO97455.1 hypothetical protein FLM11_16195 [Vibrio cholerae]TQP02160.1 hypothetical protein FLM07_10855 [Vibrio cholerae]TQP56619.1 hypothetical protein FLL95_15715 [Vibrio cholerae]